MQYIIRHRRLFQPLVTFVILVGVIYGQYILLSADQLGDSISQIGYLGLLLFSFVNGFNVIVPIVPTTFMPTLLEAGYQFWPLIAVMSIGMSGADLVGFLIGRYIGKFRKVDEWGVVKYLQSIQTKNYYAPLVVGFVWGAFVPLPTELVMVPLGIMRYQLRIIFVISLSANLIFNTLTALGFVQLFVLLLG